MRKLLGLLVLIAASPVALPAGEWSFEVRFTKAVRTEPYTGRVLLFFSEGNGEPRLGPNWFHPEPFVGVDVQDWQPDTPLTISRDLPGLLTFPKTLVDLAAKTYKVQAVARFNDGERRAGIGIGNGYSAVVDVPKELSSPVTLVIDKVVPERTFAESEWSKLHEVPSPLLSQFHQRLVSVRGGVMLPASYQQQPERQYPVIFTIPGFGGDHFAAERTMPIEETNTNGVEFIRVILDPSCPTGHHVFADSANNGPWGTALVTEWLPEFERQYRCQKGAYFLTGHSSGGWSSLWLQMTFPDTFDGVWSTAPDAVDFRDFQQADIYRAGENAWTDPAGQRRPIARRNGQVVVWWDDFDRMEQVLGNGGQFQSFEAVFSLREPDGQPRKLWDRTTGVIDPETAKQWEIYDIRRVLEGNWPDLGPSLQGKLHIFMGDQDNFYLNGATEKLQATLEQLKSDAVVEIHAGKDHGSLFSPELRDRIRKEMVQRVLGVGEEVLGVGCWVFSTFNLIPRA